MFISYKYTLHYSNHIQMSQIYKKHVGKALEKSASAQKPLPFHDRSLNPSDNRQFFSIIFWESG